MGEDFHHHSFCQANKFSYLRMWLASRTSLRPKRPGDREETPYMNIILKILRALADLPSSLRRTPRPRLIMTLLVKDEADILEQNILFHKRMGVDGFIITDNGSTDSTPQIIDRYTRKGWVLEYIREPSGGYEQKRWVDRMAWLAKTKYKAQWIINADADEFWFPTTGNLKTEPASTHANVLAAEVRNVCPEEGKPYWEWDSTIREVPDLKEYGLSPYSIFSRHYKKVMHRADGYIQISMGNHKVTMLPHRERQGRLIVYHYPVRGREHFMAKMTNGGKQLETHRGKHGGRHWRYFYALHKEGKLSEEYNRVVGLNCRKRLVRDGFVVRDSRLGLLFDAGNAEN